MSSVTIALWDCHFPPLETAIKTCTHTHPISAELLARIIEDKAMRTIDFQPVFELPARLHIYEARRRQDGTALFHMRLCSKPPFRTLRHYVRYGDRSLSADVLRMVYRRSNMSMDTIRGDRNGQLSAAAWELLDEYLSEVPEGQEVRSCSRCS